MLPRTGLILVHGIGEQKPGETTEKFLEGFLLVFPEAVFTRSAERTTIAVASREIAVYEVFWADLLSGDSVSKSFDIDDLTMLAWFPFLNRISLGASDYAWSLVLRWTITLIPLGVGAYAAYEGARMLAGIFAGVSGEVPEPPPPGGTTRQRLIEEAMASAKQAREMRTWVDHIADDYLGDVLNYVNSAGNAVSATSAFAETAYGILARFHAAMHRANDDGCGDIQVVAHSLGSVIAYHGITGFRLTADASDGGAEAAANLFRALTRVYTIGSPLEKIRFLWPKLADVGPLGAVCWSKGRPYALQCAASADPSRLRWDNFYNRLDPVSGRLKHLDALAVVHNHAVSGASVLRSHVVYERNSDFLAAISAGLVGEERRPKDVSRMRRIVSAALALGESLAAPLMLAVLVVSGLAVMVLAVLLPGFILGLPLRLLGLDAARVRLENISAAIFGATFLISLTLGALMRARDLHREHWSTERP